MRLTVGIHIQPYCVHATLIQNDKAPVILQTHTYPLSLDDNEEQRKIQISNHLKDLLEKYSPHNHHFSFIIPHKQISVHGFKFPFKERFKIQKALPFTIEDLIPFSIEEVVYTYKISGYEKQQSHILSCIASKSEISEFTEWIQSLGFQSYTLTPEISALSNLFENWKSAPPEIAPSSQPRTIKLYLGYQQSIALVLCQERVISVHNLNWGFQSCVQDISHKYRRDMNQSLDYFFENAMLTHEDISSSVPISQIIRSSFKSLAQQVQLLLIYLKGQNQGSIENIVFLGPGSKIQNLSYHLYEHVKVPVNRIEDKIEEPSFGAALETFKKSKNHAANFAQSALSAKQSQEINQKRIVLFKRVGFVCICFFCYIFVRNWQVDRVNDQMSSVFSHYSRRVAGLKTRNISVANVKKFLNQKKDIQHQSHLFQSLVHLPSAIDQLKKLSFSFNQLDLWNLTVSKMDINGNRIKLEGTILKPYLSTLKDHLKSQSQKNSFRQRKASSKITSQLKSQKDSKEEVAFNFTFKVK